MKNSVAIALLLWMTAPAGAQDDCSNPLVIVGQGSFFFDTTFATTGIEGQSESLCSYLGSSSILQDVWMEWTSDATGLAQVHTCGLATHDTKIAAYPGSGCPLDGTALACNDDACGPQSSITFAVTSGTTYTLQVGNSMGSGAGPGSIDISIAPTPPGPPPFEPGPMAAPSASPMSNNCGDSGDDIPALESVYLFSGESYQEVIDLRIPGLGMDFIWSRKYRSRIGPDSAAGNGWDYSYNVRLEQSGSDFVLFDGASRQDSYVPTGPSSWTSSEFFREITPDPLGGFQLTFADTGRWRFYPFDGSAQAGKLMSIVDRNGNAMWLGYDPQGRLASVTDTLGRPIVLAYDPQGQVASVTDFTGRQLSYAYYQTGESGGAPRDLKSVTTPSVSGTPNFNDYPGGKTTVYTYSTGNADERLNHNLLTITDPKGQVYLRNTYSSITDPNAIDFDHLVRQEWGASGDLTDLVYVAQTPGPGNNQATVKVILNDRVGNVQECFYDSGNRRVMQREYTGRAPDPNAPTSESLNRPVGQLRATDPVHFETRWEYNADSLVTRIIHPNLDEDLFTYDEANTDPRARGNLLQHCRLPGPLGGDQGQICESFEYDTGFGGCCGTNFVKREVDGRGNQTLHDYDSLGNRLRTTHRIPTSIEDFEYNSAGQMTAHTLPDNGSAHRRRDEFSYYSGGPQAGFLRAQIMDATGLALTTTYAYDLLGRRIRVVDPRGHDRVYTYNQLNQVVRETSEELTAGGVRYHRDLFYDLNDQLARVDTLNVDDRQAIDSANPYITTIHEYEVLNRLVRTTTEKGSHDVVRSPPKLDSAGLPPSEFLATEFVFDANRNQALFRGGEAVNGNQPNNVVAVSYDERDLIFRQVRGPSGPDASTDQFDYDGNGNLTRTSSGLESNPRVRDAAYDGYNRLVLVLDPLENSARHHYDANGNLVNDRIDGELLDIPGSSSNQRLSETTHTYDALDRRVTTDTAFFDSDTGAPLGDGHSITSTTYNSNSQVLLVTNDNGNASSTVYDSVNRIRVVTDALGHTVTRTYDANSNVLSTAKVDQSDSGGASQLFVTTMGYDPLDRVTQLVDNVGNTELFLYDSKNNRTRFTDARGHESIFLYDGVNRLLQAVRDMNGNGASSTDSADIVNAQSWDDSSRLIGLTDGNGNTTTLEFDALDRRVAEVAGDGTTTTFTYDVHDVATEVTDANGSVSTFSHDLLNRVILRSIVPGPGVSDSTTFEIYGHDGLSRTVHAEDDDSLVTFSYNSLSQIVRETLNGRTTSSGWDGVGNNLSNVYPDGRTITAGYDELERKQTISDQNGLITAYSYVGPERVELRDYANGTRSSYMYDGVTGVPNPPGDFGVKQMIHTKHVVFASGEVIDDRSYAWDRAYNKSERTDVRVGGPMLVHEYGYDAANRMTQSTTTPPGGTAGTIGYNLDGVGNRTTVTGGSQPGMYVMSPTLPEPADLQVNQYTNTPLDGRNYDRNGNLLAIHRGPAGSRSFAYDYRNQLVSARRAGRTPPFRILAQAGFQYDALGRRIAKVMRRPALSQVSSAPSQDRRYFYQGWQIIEEQDGDGNTLATYVYGNDIDEVLNMRRSNGVDYYFHADDRGNVMAVTDAAGAVVERYEYGDYGRPSFFDGSGNPRISSAIGNPWLFTGRQYDQETGFYNYRTRYLDPESGRFLTRDTVGIWDDELALGNGYAYAGNSPVTTGDPMGKAGGNPLQGLNVYKSKPKRPPCPCFVAGSRVWTPSGTVPIETVGVGDLVLTSPGSNDQRIATVASVSSGFVTSLVDVDTAAERLTCTPEHPFWVIGSGWTGASELKAGDRLLNRAAEAVTIVDTRKYAVQEPVAIFNLVVVVDQCYLIGDSGILVHNGTTITFSEPPKKCPPSQVSGGNSDSGVSRIGLEPTPGPAILGDTPLGPTGFAACGSPLDLRTDSPWASGGAGGTILGLVSSELRMPSLSINRPGPD